MDRLYYINSPPTKKKEVLHKRSDLLAFQPGLHSHGGRTETTAFIDRPFTPSSSGAYFLAGAGKRGRFAMSVYIASVMSVFKPLLYYGMRDARVDGLPILLDLLDRRPDPKRGLITSFVFLFSSSFPCSVLLICH
jgi:hypothetical protein